MSSLVDKLEKKQVIRPPQWMSSNIMYECYMGSVAYQVAELDSDIDVYGWCIPPKNIVFPHLDGEILGFGRQIKRFEQYQEHGKTLGEKTYDVTIYNIVKYFQLVMDNNPNMLDSLFVPRQCIVTMSPIAEMVRENRHLFLHKGCYHRMKGYAYSQLAKMKRKTPQEGSKRHELVKKYSFDVKFGYHIARLVLECEQILSEHDLDLGKNREQLKAIRKGEWKEQDIYDFFYAKEKDLEKLYHTSSLPYKPDESKIKQLLLNCLEHHYGSITECVEIKDKYKNAIDEISEIIRKTQ